jgi:GDPmannose 4,6-dehydratase
MKKALVTGITGQDGSYLAEFLLSKGYEVHGLIRRASTFNTHRIAHLYQDPHDAAARLFLHYGDLNDAGQLTNLVYNLKPDEIYHLGAQSHVRVSFDIPEYTGDITALGTTRLLEAIRRSGVKTRFYNAASSEMFGDAPPPQNELSPFRPRSPYAVAKAYSYWMTMNYRAAYGLFACNGVLFNHESPRRGETFVTRKITRGLATIKAGAKSKLYLGNIKAKRDWGYAPEYVEGMWKILQQDQPCDWVLGTGESHSVEELLEEAFAYVNMDWRNHVAFDPRYLRPTEVDLLTADSSKARQVFGWRPKVGFTNLVSILVDADLETMGLPCPGRGKRFVTELSPWWTAP